MNGKGEERLGSQLAFPSGNLGGNDKGVFSLAETQRGEHTAISLAETHRRAHCQQFRGWREETVSPKTVPTGEDRLGAQSQGDKGWAQNAKR